MTAAKMHTVTTMRAVTAAEASFTEVSPKDWSGLTLCWLRQLPERSWLWIVVIVLFRSPTSLLQTPGDQSFEHLLGLLIEALHELISGLESMTALAITP